MIARMVVTAMGAAACVLAASQPMSGGDENESALFGDTATTVDSSTVIGNAAAQKSGTDKKAVGLSGTILSLGQTGVARSYFDRPDVERASFGALTVGDFLLDVRLLRGFRAFADLETAYDPGGARAVDSGLTLRLPEIFLDANINHRAYFRVGKQVLQWGRCYFFNPTDLVNVERKSFLRRIGNRDGTYGAKVHVPFGTTANFYGFLDAHGAQRPDTLAGAAKAEYLLGGTEMAAMIWDKGGHDPVYGADLSTRLLGIDVNGEYALHQSFITRRISFPGGFPRLEEERRKWMSRAAVGLGKSFDVSGIQDRLTTVAEFYYNQPGLEDVRMPAIPPGLLSASILSSAALAAAAASGWYEPNSYSRRYAAFFATFSRFLRSDIALNLNAIGNLDQSCAIISSGISYQDINDFSLSLFLNGFAGPDNTEYTWSGQALQIEVIAEAAF